MKLSVISPTFNEAENVVRLVVALKAALDGTDYEILVVDDDSPDLTWSKVAEMGQSDPRIRVLRRTTERGLGLAVIGGFKEARGEAVACIDADLQHDPSILPKMLEQLEKGVGIVVGSRYVEGGGTQGWNWFRSFGSWAATWAARLSVGVALRDPMSGYFMLRRDDFVRVADNLNGRGFKILLEIAARLKPAGVCEVPYIFQPRTAGTSKLSSKVVFAFLQQLWRLSKFGQYFPTRFFKFAVVGSTGVVVNLVALALIIHLFALRDWRASALASSVATVNNYVLNNAWTFRDRLRTGKHFYRGYVSYALAALIGLGITTAAYAGLTRGTAMLAHFQNGGPLLPVPLLLMCQFVAVLLGTYSNYKLNKAWTWPEPTDGTLREP